MIHRRVEDYNAALETNSAVTSALETEGRLFLLVASEIEHNTGDLNLNEVEKYLVLHAISRHRCFNSQQDLDVRTSLKYI